MRVYRILLCAALTLLSSVAGAQTTIAGSTPGQFSVSDTGAATYRIPIQVPPGVAGMEPKLELVYSSHAGNGIAGVGWGLGGLSVITRCPRILGSDSVRSAVVLKNTDRFCLDGQRLLLTIGSTYGASGTEYRTERESFSKVIATGGDNGGTGSYSGPTSFTVKTKAGLTLDFGVTTDARILAPGTPAVLVWALNKVTDIKGNYLTVSYASSPADGSVYPSQIDYSGNAATGKSPGMSVRFSYAPRTDTRHYYVGGALIQVSQRLINVKTYLGPTTLVKDYRLGYVSNSNLANSTLSTITECIDASTCLAAKTFEHINVTNALGVGTVSSGTIDFGSGAIWKDSNGDGLADFCRSDINSQASCNLSNGSSFGPTLTFPSSNGNIGPDLNGDGQLDLCGLVTQSGGQNGSDTVTRQCNLTDGAGGMLATFGSAAVDEFTDQGWVDVNGDGRDDRCALVATRTSQGLEVEIITWSPTCTISTGTAWGASFAGGAVLPYAIFSGSVKWLDVDGDGQADFCWLSTGGVPQCFLSTGTSFGTTLTGAAVSLSQTQGRDWVDFNGDGKIDYCYVLNTNQVQCTINTGTAFSGTITSGALDLGVAATRVWADVNSDGKADFCRELSTNQVSCTLSTGSAFGDTVTSAVLTYGGDPKKWVDVNGDGFLDYCRNIALHIECATSRFMVSRIDKIIDGAGAYVAIGYQSIAAVSPSIIYSADAMPAYPLVNRKIPASVVSSVGTSNGIGGVVTTNYTYGGLKEELGSGRGMLGFRWLNAKNTTTGVENYTEYRQDWPYVGMTQKNETRLVGSGSAGVLKRTTVTPACKIPQSGATCVVAAGNRYFPHEVNRYEESWDLVGTAFPSISTATTYNINSPDSELRGDPSSITVTSTLNGSTSTRTTTNEYWPADTSAWVLGRLKRQTIASTVPDAGPTSNTGWAPGLSLSVNPSGVTNTSSTPGTKTAVLTPAAGGGFPAYAYTWQRVGSGVMSMSTDSQGVLTVSASMSVNQTLTETFRVTALDQSGSQTSTQVVVNFIVGSPPALVLTATPTSQSIERPSSGTATTTATASGSGGIGPYTYAWTRVSGSRTSISNATSLTPTFTASVGWGENFTETMRVTMTDSIGYSIYKDVTVQYWSPAALAASISRSPSSYSVGCGFFQFAPTSSISASGSYPPYQYTWFVTPSGNSDNGFQSVTPSGSSATIRINQTASGGSYAEAYVGTKTYNFQARVTDSRGFIVNLASSVAVTVYCPADPQYGFAPQALPRSIVRVDSAMAQILAGVKG